MKRTFSTGCYGTATNLDPDFTPYTGTDHQWEQTYTSRRLDDESGLMYYRARYYHPELGRFINRDPIGYGGGLSWYEYTRSNPLYYSDPYGLAGEEVTSDNLDWKHFTKVDGEEANDQLGDHNAITRWRTSFTKGNPKLTCTPAPVSECAGKTYLVRKGGKIVRLSCKCKPCMYCTMTFPEAKFTVTFAKHEPNRQNKDGKPAPRMGSIVRQGAMTPELLEHERLHLKIAELSARQYTRIARNFDGVSDYGCTEGTIQRDLLESDTLKRWEDKSFGPAAQYRAERTTTYKYDEDTKHGTNPERQKVWEDHFKHKDVGKRGYPPLPAPHFSRILGTDKPA